MPLLEDVTPAAMHSDDPQKQIEAIVNQVNSGFRAISNEERTKVTKDDSGTQRLLVGYQNNGFSNGNVGAKLSQVGVDVLSATSDQLIWSTDFNSFKIVASGTASVTVPDPLPSATTVSATVAHGQSSTPAYLAFVTIPSSGGSLVGQGTLTQLPGMLITNTGTSGLTTVFATASTNSTNIVFSVTNTFGAGLSGLGSPWVFKYYILKETAS